MSLFKRTITPSDLIKINNGALTVATYPEILDMLIKLNKDIYGNDIDVSSNTADGEWLANIALCLNNMCQLTLNAYNNIDPHTATGAYLDNIGALKNIYREEKSASTVSLYIKNISGSIQTPEEIRFMDKNGHSWLWKNDKDYNQTPIISFAVDEIKLLTDVKCEDLGMIMAYGTNAPTYDFSSAINGDIYQCVEAGIFKVYQLNNAIPGKERESDENLRGRILTQSSNNSVSVLSGLEAALLDIDGIEDCNIVNSVADNGTNISDGMSVPAHKIYITLRYKDEAMIDDYTIAKVIYNKLTPGITTAPYNPTSASAVINGVNKSYEFKKSDTISQTVYWKQAIPGKRVNFATTNKKEDYLIKLNKTNFLSIPSNLITNTFHKATTDLELSIAASLVEYFNNIEFVQDNVNTNLIVDAILTNAYDSRGRSLFNFNSISAYNASEVLSEFTESSLKNTYCDYKTNGVLFKYNNTNTIEIKVCLFAYATSDKVSISSTTPVNVTYYNGISEMSTTKFTSASVIAYDDTVAEAEITTTIPSSGVTSCTLQLTKVAAGSTIVLTKFIDNDNNIYYRTLLVTVS